MLLVAQTGQNKLKEGRLAQGNLKYSSDESFGIEKIEAHTYINEHTQCKLITQHARNDLKKSQENC